MRLAKLLAILAILLFPAPVLALEGDWELAGDASAFLMPDHELYGAGAEFLARYSVLDGFSLGAGLGAFGVRDGNLARSHALFRLHAGASYALDVLQWVPGVGVHFSALFAADDARKWHRDAHGLGLDFEAFVQYRGIRHLGIALFFRYHVVFADSDYMTVGLRFSWFSGEF